MVIEERIEKDVILAPFTTFKIGGPAKFFVEANTTNELIEAFEWADRNQVNCFILGGGSNVIVSDNGFDGLVIKNDCRLFEINDDVISAESGTPMSLLTGLAKRHALTGLEWAAGVPGTIGGAVRGNAGCFGSEMSAVASSVTVYNLKTKKITEVVPVKKTFEYRSSVFATEPVIILSAKLKLKPGHEAKIEAEMQEVIKSRIERQPAYPSAGSIFKSLNLDYIRSCNADLADLAVAENSFRDGLVGAGWVIEKAHLKGKNMGGALVSFEHANFIINKSLKASAEDVVVLISFVKQQIRLIYNIHLVEEIKYIGF